MLCYCKKCGRIVGRYDDYMDDPCDYCQNDVQPVPDEFLNDTKIFIRTDLEEKFFNEYIKSSPEFDQSLFDSCKQYIKDRNRRWEAEREYEKAVLEDIDNEYEYVIKCPYCNSINTQPIKYGFLERFCFGYTTGTDIEKVGKQFHCNNCDANF